MKAKYIVATIGAAAALSFSQMAVGHGDTSATDSAGAGKQVNKTKVKKKTTARTEGSKEIQKQRSESSMENDETSRAATIDSDRDERNLDSGTGEKRAPDSEYYHQ